MLVPQGPSIQKNLRNGLYHVDAELDAAVRVVRPRIRNSADAVVAVAQELDAQAEVLRCQFVESGKVEHHGWANCFSSVG